MKKSLSLKVALAALLFVQYTGTVFGLSNFNGFSELRLTGGLDPKVELPVPGSTDLPTPAQFDGALFFDGQIDFWKYFSSKFSFSARGEDIIPFGVTNAKTTNTIGTVVNNAAVVAQTNPVTFTLEEASLTFRFRYENWNYSLSVFAGAFESPGTDIFLQKHFGLEPISSIFMQKRMYQTGTPIYPIEGLGFSFAWRFAAPFALAFYVAVPPDLNIGTNPNRMISFDLRFSGVFSKWLLDFTAGAALPGASPIPAQQGNMTINAGLTLLFGNPNTAAALIQLGVKSFDLTSINFDTIYALLEPRFTLGSWKISLGVFALPKNSPLEAAKNQFTPAAFDNLLYVAQGVGLGGGLMASFNNIRAGSAKGQFGVIAAGGLKERLSYLLSPPAAGQVLQISAQIGIFFSLEVYNGIFNILAKVDPLNQVTSPTAFAPVATLNAPASDPLSSIKLQLGYLVHF